MEQKGRQQISINGNNKITQAEFTRLYVSTVDHPMYRPLVNGQRHFRLAALLIDHQYALDLSYLSLRHLNFRHADFTGINLEGADLSGAICNYADFTEALFMNIIIDSNTRLYKAKLTHQQLIELGAEVTAA